AHAVAKPRADEHVSVNQPAIGCEDKIGQSLLGLYQLDKSSQVDECLVERRPLLPRFESVAALLDVHPGIDFILDPEIIGWTHQKRSRWIRVHCDRPGR